MVCSSGCSVRFCGTVPCWCEGLHCAFGLLACPCPGTVPLLLLSDVNMELNDRMAAVAEDGLDVLCFSHFETPLESMRGSSLFCSVTVS